MKEQLATQKLLQKKLDEIQLKNRSFSIRAFAKMLGLQPSATNEILKGKRRISKKLAEKIALKLHLDPSERVAFISKFPNKQTRIKGEQEAKQEQQLIKDNERYLLKLKSDQYALISDWLHFAFLSYLKTKKPSHSLEKIAQKLCTTTSKLEKAIELLLRLKLIQKTNTGGWERVYTKINTSDDVLDLSIQKAHLEAMETAKEKLLKHTISERDYTSITLPMNPDLLPKVKEIIRAAQDEISNLVEKNDCQEVYQLSCYLYPLTSLNKKEYP